MFFKYCTVLLIFFVACEGTDEIFIVEQPDDPTSNNNQVISSGKFYEKNNKQYLWAGEDSTTHFDITNWSLNNCYLSFGLGRETFNALIRPNYTPLDQYPIYLPDTSRVVILKTEKGIKAYPLGVLKTFELINEEVNGDPVMIVYCFLANLVSVYTREYCGETLTFAVSGYTYKDPYNYNGLESFILWDRNSESLWWPINDKAASGSFQGRDLMKYNRNMWSITDMKNLRLRYPKALVLDQNQTFIPPSNIKKIKGC